MLDIAKSEIEEQMKFVKENDVCKVMSYKGNVFGVEPPTFVELEVVDTEPGFAGNTSTNATKPATLETGATIQVPLFVDMKNRRIHGKSKISLNKIAHGTYFVL